MELQKELQEIMDNLSTENDGDLKDYWSELNIDEIIGQLEALIDHIEVKTPEEVHLIDEKIIAQLKRGLMDETERVKCIQEATLKDDGFFIEKINYLKYKLDCTFLLCNLRDASICYDRFFGGIFLRYYRKLCSIYWNRKDEKRNLFVEMCLREGNIAAMQLSETESQMLLQLSLLIQYYELDMSRKYLINLVKQFSIVTELKNKEG